MGKKGARFVLILVGLVYPLITAFTIFIVMAHDPEFPGMLTSSTGGSTNAAQKAANPNGLTDWEMEHGIGPITSEIKLSAIDEKMAAEGEKLFKMKCMACHKLDERYVGPPLRGVTTFRKPEFIMNMILNPSEMIQRHPIAKGLLAQYFNMMTPQGLDEQQARAVLEYLRWDFEQNNK